MLRSRCINYMQIIVFVMAHILVVYIQRREEIVNISNYSFLA